MKIQNNSNPVLNFREKQDLEKNNVNISSITDKKKELLLSAHGTMITETREQIDTSEISG